MMNVRCGMSPSASSAPASLSKVVLSVPNHLSARLWIVPSAASTLSAALTYTAA